MLSTRVLREMARGEPCEVVYGGRGSGREAAGELRAQGGSNPPRALPPPPAPLPPLSEGPANPQPFF